VWGHHYIKYIAKYCKRLAILSETLSETKWRGNT
jgi:hypothetical protein